MPPRNRQRPRRAPTSQQEEETVQILLEATRRVFAREGLAGMTTTRVAEEAGVAVGTVYRYFPAKDALVRLLLERMHNHATDVMTEVAVAAMAQPEVVIERMVAAVVALGAQFQPELAAWTELAPHLGIEAFAEQQRRFIDLVESIIVARRHRVDVANPRLAAFVVVTAVTRTILSATTTQVESLTDGTLTEELTRLVTGYLRVREP